MLDERLRALCKGKNFGALTTLFGDGRPQTNIMWVDCDEDHVIVNTERHRAKFRNMSGDPRVAIAIWKAEDPYSFIEVRGRVVRTEGGQAAFQHINRLANEYTGQDYALDVVSERMMVWIAPDELSGFG